MCADVAVIAEYAQASLILIYYWIRALVRLLFVSPVRKSVAKETILVTGAGQKERNTLGNIVTSHSCDVVRSCLV
jgi:hypothetical protein